MKQTTIRLGGRELTALQYLKNVYPFSIVEKKDIMDDDFEVVLNYNQPEDLIYAGMQMQRMAYPLSESNSYHQLNNSNYPVPSFADEDRMEDYAS